MLIGHILRIMRYGFVEMHLTHIEIRIRLIHVQDRIHAHV